MEELERLQIQVVLMTRNLNEAKRVVRRNQHPGLTFALSDRIDKLIQAAQEFQDRLPNET